MSQNVKNAEVVAQMKYLLSGIAFVEELSKASTSEELSQCLSSCDAEKMLFKDSVIKAVLSKHSLVSDAASAHAVVSFLRDTSRPASLRPSLRSVEVRDLIVHVLIPKVSPGDFVGHVGMLICNLTHHDKTTAELIW